MEKQNFRICGISWYDSAKRMQIEIGKDVDIFFSRKNRYISLDIDGKEYYTKLPNSFFTSCKHLRTAYDNPDLKGKNRLHSWVINNDVKKAKLQVVKRFYRYKLSKEN